MKKNNKNYLVEYPKVKEGNSIEKLSLQCVEEEALQFSRFRNFSKSQQHVVKRMIHATTCSEKIIESIIFQNSSPEKIVQDLKSGAVIICDTKMIQTGLSSYYLEKYQNQTVCYVSDTQVIQKAREQKTTRSYLAVQKALQKFCGNKKIILASGNAPTFLYAAVNWLVQNNISPQNISFLAMPVGYINVQESKEYAMRYMKEFSVSGITLQGSYGSSSLVVSVLHALYRWEL